ncbi:DUF4112 domain-containing protein [Roseobacter denitrificans]|uniref:DUF4112 domain-containing protein n=1 Tax=Roseobacter denitrificans (strain ATCC 33942 / OCh 114) TaxID=375451 RepID=Q166Q5_ROSDO|nr:DUF4112 domain-containing protein [Roseobacter denitrificans]ABG32038.1 hypothetical protein RD1_2473 [Roseobacter denitrificans OCh 114]AVL51562.1 DUF4112 domain-containing protein [Roseobacter denitrificans]SFG36673.1 protein of unknown function [Roseobacter denitrificans OCh 114]
MRQYSIHREHLDRLERLERLAKRFDSRFRMPLIGVRFGWDGILGFVPGIGDVATTLPSVLMIYEGTKMGVRRRTLMRMGLNTGLDLTVGAFPLFGDVFDLHFKSHQRNIGLLRKDVLRHKHIRSFQS